MNLRNKVAFFLFMLLLDGFLLSCKKEPPQLPVEPPVVLVAEAVQKSVPIYSDYVATVDAGIGATTVEIRARVPAFLLKQHFEEGQKVREGQVLFTLDDRSYQADLKSAQAALAKAKADLSYALSPASILTAKANLAAAQAQLANAELNEARLKPLAEKKAVPQQDYDNASTALKVAKANLAAGQAAYDNAVLTQQTSIEMARAAVQAAQADIAKAKIFLDYCTITSPLEGMAGRRMVAPGNLVGQGDATLLTTVTSLNTVRVNFNLSESDYLLVMKNIISGRDKDRKLPTLELFLSDESKYPEKGKIIIANPSLDPQTGTMLVVGEFSNPQHLLRPGMFGRIRLEVDYDEDAVLIPQKAVSELQSAKIAYLVGKDNKVLMRTLELGNQVDDLVVVKNGIKAGDLVITEGLLKVHPGMVVNPGSQPATSEPGKK